MSSISFLEIPRELKIAIIPYFHHYSNYLHFCDLTLNQRDFIYLVQQRFPEFCTNNIGKYNVEYLYKSLLFIPNIHISSDIILRITRYEKEAYNLREIFCELYRYIILEHDTKGISIDLYTMYSTGDFDIFMKLKDHILTLNKYEVISNSFHDNGIKILEGILSSNFYSNDDVVNSFINSHKRTRIDENFIQLIINRCVLSTKNLIDILLYYNYDNIDVNVISTIMNKFPADINIDLLVTALQSVGEYSDDKLVKWETFRQIWIKYNSMFTDKHISELYKALLDDHRISVFLANHPVVIKEYLGDDIKLLFQK